MVIEKLPGILVEQKAIASSFLNRQVIVDVYLPRNVAAPSELSLLLINDGQDLSEMNFSRMLEQLLGANQIGPVLCVGVHAGKDRKNEYGTANKPDYMNRGAKAGAYSRFVLEELLPLIHADYRIEQ